MVNQMNVAELAPCHWHAESELVLLLQQLNVQAHATLYSICVISKDIYILALCTTSSIVLCCWQHFLVLALPMLHLLLIAVLCPARQGLHFEGILIKLRVQHYARRDRAASVFLQVATVLRYAILLAAAGQYGFWSAASSAAADILFCAGR